MTTAAQIGAALRERLARYQGAPMVYEYGTVLSAGDGVVRIEGLPHTRYGELIAFDDDVFGMAMNLELGGISAVLLNGIDQVRAGERVRGTGVAYDLQECYEGMACVAAPVRSSGRAIAAVSVTGPTNRIDLTEMAPAVQHAAAGIWQDRFETRRGQGSNRARTAPNPVNVAS